MKRPHTRPTRPANTEFIKSYEPQSVTEFNSNISGTIKRSNKTGVCIELRVWGRTIGWFVPARPLPPPPTGKKRGPGLTTTTLRPVPPELARPIQLPVRDTYAAPHVHAE